MDPGPPKTPRAHQLGTLSPTAATNARSLAPPRRSGGGGKALTMSTRAGAAASVVLAVTLSATACGRTGDTAAVSSPTHSIATDGLKVIGHVDERYQSFNVEMIEVTGGRFWKPYGRELDAILKDGTPASEVGDTPAGMDPRLYQYRPPIDLANVRLRRLASALGPAYVRVSGTWANTTYFPDSEAAPSTPPPGFAGVLTHAQWKGVLDFSRAVDAKLVTSFATGVGVRDATGAWTDRQARRLVEFTRANGGTIAAAEFMNEPTLAAMGGAPKGYDAAAYGRDFKRFRQFAKEAAPDMLILGPGAVGETTGSWGVAYGDLPVLKTRELLAAAGPGVNAFSYHHYGASSQRCAAMGMQTTAQAALSEEWLRRTDETLAFYRQLRDEFEPGKPFWNTETADAACGGNPWANTFLDTFRYLDQLGRLAKQEVKVVMHNTLVASDYGLLADSDFTPKPNYWAAVLWRRLMGPTVLESGVPIQAGLHVYAHCLRGTSGGVALLALNTSRTDPAAIAIPKPAEAFTLTAVSLQGAQVRLNGRPLVLQANDELPALQGRRVPAGRVALAPASITFLRVPEAGNASCP